MSLSPEQLATRRNFVTASDCARLFTGRYGGAYAVWMEKQPGYVPAEATDAMQDGLDAEPMLRKYIERSSISQAESEIGIRIVAEQAWVTAGRIGATVDLLSAATEPYELKTCIRDLNAARHEWGEAGSDEVPDNYFIQVQMQCYVLDADMGHIIALLAGRGVVRFDIPHDRALTEELAARATAWFDKHVVGNVPPDLDDETAYAISPIAQRRAIVPTKTIAVPARQGKPLIRLLDDARRTEALGKKMGEIAKARLSILAGDAGEIVSGNLRATWQARQVKRLDVQKLRTEYPEIYAKCQRIDVDRVLKTGGDDDDGE